MDDFSTGGDRLERALHELRNVNRFLGGYRALRRVIDPLLRTWSGGPLQVLDLGAGLADHAVELIGWGRRRGVSVHVTALDANAAVVEYARAFLERALSARARPSVRMVQSDALDAPFPPASFHVVTASLFLHHLDDAKAAALLNRMDEIASVGIIVNDLHRHPLAYAGIRALAAVLPVSSMFRHDGPLSVRRAFTPDELERIAEAAGLAHAEVRRHWAFRLTLSTLPPSSRGGR